MRWSLRRQGRATVCLLWSGRWSERLLGRHRGCTVWRHALHRLLRHRRLLWHRRLLLRHGWPLWHRLLLEWLLLEWLLRLRRCLWLSELLLFYRTRSHWLLVNRLLSNRWLCCELLILILWLLWRGLRGC